MSQPTTSPDANIALVRVLQDAFNTGDLDACVAHLAPDFVINLAELPQPLRGPSQWRQNAEVMRRAFPDVHVRIEDIFAAEDRIAVRLTISGTHSGEFLGIPATGRSIQYVSHEFYRVADGLIAEEWICSDTVTLVRQISASATADQPEHDPSIPVSAIERVGKTAPAVVFPPNKS